MKKILISILICLLVFPPFLFAADHYPATCSYVDVKAKYDIAADGDRIFVPIGTCTWETQLLIDAQSNGRMVSLIGDSGGGTIIALGAGIGNDYIIRIKANDTPFRITRININGNKTGKGIYVDSSPKGFRIDHNIFTYCKSYQVYIAGRSWGVVDHNEFLSCQGGCRNDGAASVCAAAAGLGTTTDTVFFEDNIWDYNAADYNVDFATTSHIITMGGCAKTVFRYNNVDLEYGTYLYQSSPFDVHGYCFNSRYNGNNEGTYTLEAYGNTFNLARALWPMNIRGGYGVISGNIFTVGSWASDPSVIRVNNYRSWQDCGTKGLCSENEGYPCISQIGREGDLYIWDNTLDGSPLVADTNIKVCPDGDTPTHIQINRDYFLYSGVTAVGYTYPPYPHPLVGGDTTPPVVQNIVPLPTHEYPSGTTIVTVTWDTDECAKCRIGEVNEADPDDLTYLATVEVQGACDSGYGTSFSYEVTGLSPEDAKTYYIGGEDDESPPNKTTSNEVSAFTVAALPPPGDRMTVTWQ